MKIRQTVFASFWLLLGVLAAIYLILTAQSGVDTIRDLFGPTLVIAMLMLRYWEGVLDDLPKERTGQLRMRAREEQTK